MQSSYEALLPSLTSYPSSTSRQDGAVAVLGKQGALKTQAIQRKPALKLVWF